MKLDEKEEEVIKQVMKKIKVSHDFVGHLDYWNVIYEAEPNDSVIVDRYSESMLLDSLVLPDNLNSVEIENLIYDDFENRLKREYLLNGINGVKSMLHLNKTKKGWEL